MLKTLLKELVTCFNRYFFRIILIFVLFGKYGHVIAYSFQQLQDHGKDNETIDSSTSYSNTYQQQQHEQMHRERSIHRVHAHQVEQVLRYRHHHTT